MSVRSPKYSILDIPLGGGLDESFGNIAAPPGVLYEFTNYRRYSNNPPVKRRGTDAVTLTTNTPNYNRIAGDGTSHPTTACTLLGTCGDLDIIGNGLGGVFSRDEVGSVWAFGGRIPSAIPLGKSTAFFSNKSPGSGYGNRPASCAINDDGYLFVCAYDGKTQAYIESPDGSRIWSYEAGTATFARVINVGSTFWFCLETALSLTVSKITISGSSVTFSGAGGVGTKHSGGFWDVSADQLNSTFYIVFQSAATTVTIKKINNTGGVDATQTFSCTGLVPLSITAITASGSTEVWVGYYDDPTATGNANWKLYDTSLTLTTSGTIATAVDILGPPLFGAYVNDVNGPNSSGKAFYVVRYREESGEFHYGCLSGTVESDATLTGPDYTYGALPISKPDTGCRVWCLAGNGASNAAFNRNVLLRFHPDTEGLVSAGEVPPTVELSDVLTPKFGDYGPTRTSGGTTQYDYFGHVAEHTKFKAFVAPFGIAYDNQVSSQIASQDLYKYHATENTQHLDHKVVGPGVITAGTPTQVFGKPSGSTGASNVGNMISGCAESGFAAPPVITTTASTPGGSGVGPGTYSYRAVYEWVDLYGNRHRSLPSPAVSVTITSISQIDVTVSAPNLTQRNNPLTSLSIGVRLYRTVNGGQIYHNTFAVQTAASTTADVTFADVYTDANISSQEILYTDGGVLGNDLAPSCRFVATSEERVWCGGGWYKNQIQCSKVLVPNEPVQFTNDASHIVVLPEDCTGLAYMDGAVLAFTGRNIYVISGDGPNDQGIGGFAPPRGISPGIGCTNYRSIVETPIGIMFQNEVGLYLLPRGLGTPTPIGDKIRDTFGSAPFVLSSCFGSYHYTGPRMMREARFLLVANDPTTSGAQSTNTVMTFNVDDGIWSKDTYTGSSGAYAIGILGAWSAGYSYGHKKMDADATMVWEDDSGYTDEGSQYIVADVATDIMHPFGPNGQGLVKTVAVYAPGSNGATMQVTTTIDGTAVTNSWNLSNGDAGYRQGTNHDQHKCSRLSVKISDSASVSGGTSGFKPVGLSLELETDSKLRELAQGDRA